MTDTIEAPAPAIAMTPGRYLRLRREAAALTIDHVAITIDALNSSIGAGRPVALGRRLYLVADRAAVRHQLACIEDDKLEGGDQVELVDLLGAVYSFDPAIYWLLVGRAADPDGDVPEPRICRLCACTWNDPCTDSTGESCGWLPDDPSLCTMCIGKGPANDQGEASHAA